MDNSNLRMRREEGQTLVMFALFGFVLVGVMALALDVGYLLSERREAQAAADAAALAGARALLAGESDTGVAVAARNFARSNGLPSEMDRGAISVDIEGDRWDGAVTVELQMDVQRYFLGAIYNGPWGVEARAVARITDQADANYILIALDKPGLYVNGSMSVRAVNGSIISNADITSSGEANIIVTDGFIDAAGTVQERSGWQAPWGIRDKRAPAKDPFDAYAAPPKPPGPPITGTFRCNPRGFEDASETGTDCNFAPGYYKNARIRTWDVAHFAPGLYYFENSSIEIRSTTGRVEGSGVNFYFTGNPNQAYFDPRNGEVHLTAPGWNANPDLVTVNGDYRDLVIWFSQCPGPTYDASGNGEFFLGGVLYAPCSHLYLHGNPNGETISGMVIGKSIEIKGTSDVLIRHLPYAPTASYEVYLAE